MPGIAGTRITTAEIRRQIRAGAKDPTVQALRDELVRDLPEHDRQAEAQAIFDFTRRAIRYTDDPVDVETVKSARFVVQEYAAGRRIPADCVTETILIGALARSLRIPVRIRIIGKSQPRPDFTHVHAELKIDGRWVALDATAASSESDTIRARAGLGYRHPAELEQFITVKERPMYITRGTPATALIRRRQRLGRLGRLGAEPVVGKEQEAVAKEAAKGAATGSIFGPIGTAAGAIGGGVMKIFQGIGLAKKARAGRIAAQNQLEVWKHAAYAFNKETKRLRGKPLIDSDYEYFKNMALEIHHGSHQSAKQYAAEAGFG